ncbi:MAG: HAMP domain-containing histidine kinase [Bryobacteraceae bacterium]|nr:HAMP domain-containing histidine kinase [Bryobacteraceae bacterium]
MPFPKVRAAQRLQTLLLLTTLTAMAVAVLLFSDLVRSFRSTVVSDAGKSLANAVRELLQERAVHSHPPAGAGGHVLLQRVSYDVLRSYPDVEGGYIAGESVIGHSFPTYTEPGSALRQPPIERDAVLDALAESRRTGEIAQRVFDDHLDLVVVSVLAPRDGDLAAWGLKRYIGFNQSRHLQRNLIPVGVLVLGLLGIAGALGISYRLQRGFAAIQAGLAQLQTDPSYRLSGQQHELQPIVTAINRMAESRQRLEADLRREDRLRVMGRVVAGIAHEIRNPLNSIRLTVQMLARRLRGNEAAEESVPMVLAEVNRLDSLLKSLLVFGAGEPERPRRQPVRPILERTLALAKLQMRERSIEAELDGPADLCACVNADHLQQAVMNLVLNAIDAAEPGGRVAVAFEQVDSRVRISVKDSGPGLTARQQEHLFEAFYTTKSSGAGLGLAVTRILLEKMGATIEYVPDADAHGDRPSAAGAHFRIELPAEAAAGARA